MTKDQQINLNIQLSQNLANYLMDNPSERISHALGTSYVVFSADNDELNIMNAQLIEPLKSEGKAVVKAQESHDGKPWVLSLVPA